MAKSRKNNNYETHSFYCIKCGRQGIPIVRNRGHLHSKSHRKLLYCPFCQEEINHIEVRNMEEAIAFKTNFEKGVYKDEAAQSLHYVRNSRQW